MRKFLLVAALGVATIVTPASTESPESSAIWNGRASHRSGAAAYRLAGIAPAPQLS